MEKNMMVKNSKNHARTNLTSKDPRIILTISPHPSVRIVVWTGGDVKDRRPATALRRSFYHMADEQKPRPYIVQILAVSFIFFSLRAMARRNDTPETNFSSLFSLNSSL